MRRAGQSPAFETGCCALWMCDFGTVVG